MIYTEYQRYKQVKTPMPKIKLEPTGADIEGPFYKEGAPFGDGMVDYPTLFLTGKVLNVDGEVVKDAVLDFWQADKHGVYDLDGFKFRCKVKVDEHGIYKLATITPGDYQISETEFRCAHIHVKFSAPGYKPLTTQLYFADDKYNSTDHWFDPKRIIAMGSPVNEGTFNFVVEKV